MNKIESYIEVVGLEGLLLFAFAAVLIPVLTPGRLRLPLALAIMPAWMILSRLPDLGAINAFSKATGFICFSFVGLAAALHPGPRRPMPLVVGAYPIVLAPTVLWAINAPEPMLDFSLNFQWFLLSVAALLVARTICSADDLRRVFNSLTLGTAVAIGVVFMAIVKSPDTMFRAGLGRFFPWGANANQIASLFIFGVPMLVYYGLRGRYKLLRPAALAIAAAGVLMAIMTASRSTVFPMALLLAVVGWEFRRNPITLMVGAAALAIGLFLGTGLLEQTAVDRLGSIETGRYQKFVAYLQEIAKRPILGQLTNPQPAPPDDQHAHNAYLQVLYDFGLVIGLPLFSLAGLTLAAAWRVWRRRAYLPVDPTFTTLICAMMAMVYLHGLATLAIYYSTYSWAFINIMISCLLLALGSSRAPALSPGSRREPNATWPEDPATMDADGAYPDEDSAPNRVPSPATL